MTGLLCNGIACQDCGAVTGADVVALLGRASGFMAKVGCIRSQASETPSVQVHTVVLLFLLVLRLLPLALYIDL